MTADVVSAIQVAMSDDDENQSARLLNTYTEASTEAKAAIDDVLICLCGYSLPSLIERAHDLED